MHKSFYILCVLFFVGFISNGQERAIENIPNQPSSEAYDLMKDSKGYIWVAHEFGISRYDGANFITLHHPDQNSISFSDMVEDKMGRIWCHNFSGQIYYVKDLQLHLLKEYVFEEEQGFPRITICGDELVATSKKGLFVYNLVTGKSAYHFIEYGTNSLTRVGQKVVCFNGYGFFCYEAGKPITKLSHDKEIPDYYVASLQTVSVKDTFFLIVNPNGIYYKLLLKENRISTQSTHKTGAFINTLSANDNNIWINTKEHSFTADKKDSIQGMNLSDVVTDNNGNLWMSSLKKGLCVQYNTQPLKTPDNPLTKQGQNVRQIHAENNMVFFGTSDGKMYKITSQSAMQYLLSVPKEAGAIERIASFTKDNLFLAASVGSYTYNYVTNKVKPLPVSITAKDILIKNEVVYVATPFGIKFFPVSLLNESAPPLATKPLLGKTTRCRSITFLNDSLIAAFNDGVFIFYKNKMLQLTYKQKPIYATTVRVVGNKLLIGTYSQGLLIFEKGAFQNITEKEGLAYNFVKDIKTAGHTTWVVYADRFQSLNSSLTGIDLHAFPFYKGAINDFHTSADQLYFSTSDGLYSLQITRSLPPVSTNTYIDKVIVNGNGLLATKQLQHYHNHLQFQVSTPFYSGYSKITYRYRIKKQGDAWQLGVPGQTVFNLVALEPGAYDFEIVATDENRKIVSWPAAYHFEIMPPWYQQWTARIAGGLVLVSLVSTMVWLYFRSRLRRQQQEYEKILAVQEERQRISFEIHDDIGAGLSAIRLLTEMTKAKLPETDVKKEVEKIHSSISELTNKIREVIWSLNTDNDNLENLLYYIQRQSFLLFQNAGVSLKASLPVQAIPQIIIKGDKRRHIYLAIKEALHNCLRHSKAADCVLSMEIREETLAITVKDNGKGFAPLKPGVEGNGLKSMKRRMQQIGGVFHLDSSQGTQVHFSIPLNEKA